MVNLSVIIPTFNGEKNLKSLYSRLKIELPKLKQNYEVIFIDDGGRDKSFNILKNIHQQDKRVKVIKFDKNYGQHSAIHAGMKMSRGEILVTLDDDMVNCVAEIHRFVNEIDKGKDIVFGWRYPRTNVSYIRKMISFFINFFISLLIGVRVHDPGCGLKCFRREILNDEENHLELIRKLRKYKFKELKIRCSESSESRYNLLKFIQLFFVIILNVFGKNTLRYHLG